MRVVIRTISSLKAHQVRVAELTFEDGSWVRAAEAALNVAKGYEGAEWRFLISANYLGGGFAPPFGQHKVVFARYSDDARAYRFDEPLMLEVTRE